MGRIIVIALLAIALSITGAWYLGLFPTERDPVNPNPIKPNVVPKESLGDDLYTPAKFPVIPPSNRAANAEPTVIYGRLNAFETEEVAAEVQGKVLFIGELVDESAVLVAGSAPFVAEPYYFQPVRAGRYQFVKFYRRLYEGDTVHRNQVLGMINPAEALGTVLEKLAKIAAAHADYDAAKAGEAEGFTRYRTAERLFKDKVIAREDFGAALLTYIKLKSEAVSAGEKIKLAEIDKDLADIKLQQHEIRALLPYPTYTLKSIKVAQGAYAKNVDPIILTVQSLERLMAEAMIEEQYFAPFKFRKEITATIEPTILEKPFHEVPAHDADINSVAVTKNMKVVSGSEDKSVCVWSRHALAPERKYEHDDAVKVVICALPAAKHNLCIVGCANGSIYLWDLDKDDKTPAKRIDKGEAHGSDVSITALAYSADGRFFASGASDGSIRMWSAEDATQLYPFLPENGVGQCHEDAVTALTFTPQSRLVSAGRDKTLHVWQLKEKGAAPDGKPILYREGNVPQLGVSQDGKWMLFDQGRTLKLLSVEDHTLKHTLNMPTNSTPFDTLALFSPDGSLMLTAGVGEGRLQLWKTPDAESRGFEVRQFAPREKLPVACAAFSPDAGKGGPNSFAVSASGQKLYLWSIPTPAEISDHRIHNVRMTLKSQQLDSITGQMRIGFEVDNSNRRFEAGRPVVIVID